MMLFKEKFKTYKNVFDDFTERNLFKLISQGYFDGIESPISIGKEANIFSAIDLEQNRLILKIYRLSTCDFNRMFDYIKLDPRYSSVKKRKREIIFSWAQREYRNLLKIRDLGVRVPTPKHVFFNILIIEFIGSEDPAPKLKDLAPKNPKDFFEDLINQMKKLYKGKYVHTDLSAFNILNFNEKPIIIDLSQATTIENPEYENYWKRDIHNVVKHFQKLGLKLDEDEIKKKIMN